MYPFLRSTAAYLIWLITLSLVFSAFVFGPWLLSLGWPSTAFLTGAAAAVIGTAVAAMQRSQPAIPAWVERPGTWIAIVAAGCIVRLGWSALCPATLISDPRDFYDLAMHVLSEGRYYSSVATLGLDGQPNGPAVELRAWRPPGLPLLLAAWFWLFGAGSWAIIIFNVVVYAASALVLRSAALRLIGPAGVAPVQLFFAAWPKHIGYTPLPLTENLSLLLLVSGILLFDAALAGSRRAKLYAGLVYGAVALVRPSLVLLPGIWTGMAWVGARSFRHQMLIVGTSVFIGLTVIAPWTVRNAMVLGHPVLISTNGGDVLYRANNPQASGNWKPAGERDLAAQMHDEVQWNATGSAWAWEWIKSNPAAFAGLAIRKAGLLWGWEEEGILFPMHYPGLASASGGLALAVCILMNLWWFTLLCAVAASLIYQRTALTQSSLALGLMMTVLLLTAVHMVYESHARYHMPFTGALILLACTGLAGCGGTRPKLAAP